MSLTKKRKQLIAASLAAMTAFGATVPAIVASAPAAFAATVAEQNGNSEPTSKVTLTETSADTNIFNMTNTQASDLTRPGNDFQTNKEPSKAETEFAEVTVDLTDEAAISGLVDGTDYIVRTTNPAIEAWYGDNWNKNPTAWQNTAKEAHLDGGVKLKKVTGADIKAGLNFITTSGGNTVKIEIFNYTAEDFTTDTAPTNSTAIATFEFVDQLTYTDVVEPVTPDITVDAAGESTQALTGERKPADEADFGKGDKINTAGGYTAESFTQGAIAFNVADLQDDGNYVLKQTNPAIWNWYTTDWTGNFGVLDPSGNFSVDAASGEVHEGTSAETAVKYKKYTGAELKDATTFLMQKGGEVKFEIYAHDNTNNAKDGITGPALVTATVTDSVTWSTKVTPGTPAIGENGEATVSQATVEVEGTGSIDVVIPATDLENYLTGNGQITVDGAPTELAPTTTLTVDVVLPEGATANSIALPNSVVTAAANADLVINVKQGENLLYTWTKAAANPNAASAQLRYAAPGAEARVGDDSVDLSVTVDPVSNDVYEGYNVTFPASAPTTGWTFTIPNVENGTYALYADQVGTEYTGNAEVNKNGTDLEITGMAAGETLSVLKRVSSGNTGGGSTIPGGGGGGTTDPGEESNVQLDTQIVYMINEVSLYDFLVEGNNDTDNITVTSSNEAVATVALQDGADTRGAKYRVTTHGTGEATITVTYNGESATMDVVVYPKGGSITLDTVNYRMAPGNIYDIGVTVTDGAGTALSGEQVQQMYQNGTLRVTDSRTGSIVDLTQLPNGNFRVTGKNAGTCWITYEVIQDGVAVTHASVKVDVAAGVTQGGVATRDTSWWADKSADTTTQA